MVLSHQGKKEFASPVEPMTPEALALHFIDDLDSKINQLRASREAATGMQFHRGLGRYVYLPALRTPEQILADREEEALDDLAALSADPHALEMAEMEMAPEIEEGDGTDEAVEATAEVQAPLFRVE